MEEKFKLHGRFGEKEKSYIKVKMAWNCIFLAIVYTYLNWNDNGVIFAYCKTDSAAI